jgi:rod shape-determining protein MreD
LIKGDLLNHLVSTSLDIDVIVIITVYLMGSRSEIGAGVFALGQGLLMDIFSGSLWGFNAMLYIIVFLFIRMISRPFDLFSIFGQVTVIFMGVMAKDILMLLLLYVFSLNRSFSSIDFLFFVISAACSGLLAPLIFILLDSAGRFFQRVRRL